MLTSSVLVNNIKRPYLPFIYSKNYISDFLLKITQHLRIYFAFQKEVRNLDKGKSMYNYLLFCY